MANDKQSLTNYETILWLWDATDEQRIMFLASLNPDQRSQFCDVLRDVLNNPWEGRSAIKLTKLNKLLGQNVDRIKKQVQFSGDRTPDLDEKQIFRLLHDYTVLNHDGTRRLTALGKQNLEQLLMTVDAEFETYYDRDGSHPQLMWNGFQNDTQFLNEGMEKTQVEPTDYGELNAKITNYYFPVGGGPKPKPKDENDYDYQGDYQGGEDDNISPDSLQIMHLRYLPVFLSYIVFAVHAGFFGIDTPWSILFGLITLFGSVKWYNIFKFYDRGWSSLFQGFWVLNYSISLALSAGGVGFFVFALAWPLAAFWFLARKLHCNTTKQSRFITTWTVVLCVVGVIAAITFSSRQHAAYVQRQESIRRHLEFQQRMEIEKAKEKEAREQAIKERKLAEERRAEEQRQAKERKAEERRVAEAKAAEAHIAKIRSREGGVSWDGLINSDLKFLTADEIETLRLQLTSTMRAKGGNMAATAIESIRPSKRNGRFRVSMSLNEPIYVALPDKSGLTEVLGTGSFSYIDLDTPAGTMFACDLIAGRSHYEISKSTAYDDDRRSRLLFGHVLAKDLERKSSVYIQVGSQADSSLKALADKARQIRSQIKADELVSRADPTAQGRLNVNNQKLRYLRDLVKGLSSVDGILTVLPDRLKRVADFDDWSEMGINDNNRNSNTRRRVR